MAVNRPIRWEASSTALKEMSDSDLELLSYHLRKAWAADLSATYTGDADRNGSATATNGFGAIYRGGSGSASDSNYEYVTALTDKRKNAVYTSKSNNAFDNNADDDDTFDAPSEATFDASEAVRQTFYYEEWLNASPPGDPSNATKNSESYVKWDSSGYLKIEGVDANLIDTIIAHANYNMLNDDGVGLLSVATSSPGGDYTDLGAFHQNTIMTFDTGSPTTDGGGSSVVATNNLYIRTQNSSFDEATPRAAETSKFMLWDAGNTRLIQVDIASNDYANLITNILLPIWKRSSSFGGTSGDYGFPRYKFETSVPSNTYDRNQGTLLDTVYTDSAEQGVFGVSIGSESGTYYKARYGTGATSTLTTHYFTAYVPSGAVRTV
tara:strand:- start:365 stop:1504 length:1140 start_codon:yes stop_codon:yes gene_type:complete